MIIHLSTTFTAGQLAVICVGGNEPVRSLLILSPARSLGTADTDRATDEEECRMHPF